MILLIVIALAMTEEPQTRRDWSGIGCGAFLVLFATFFVYARWPDPERDLVRQREEFASWLTEQGGFLKLADLSQSADSSQTSDMKLPFSNRRQRLGDKPVRVITLPYGYPEAVTARAKSLFPEAVEWSVLPVETSLVRLLGDAKAVEVVRQPDRVEVQRLQGKEVSHVTKAASLADFPPKGDVMEVPPELAARLSEGLLNPEIYQWGDISMCLPHYGVRLTYFRGADRVDVLFCFECGVLKTFWNQRSAHGQSFSRAYNLFADAMKELFPHDEQIQAIRPRDERGVRIDKPLTPAVDSTPSATGSDQRPTPGR